MADRDEIRKQRNRVSASKSYWRRKTEREELEKKIEVGEKRQIRLHRQIQQLKEQAEAYETARAGIQHVCGLNHVSRPPDSHQHDGPGSPGSDTGDKPGSSDSAKNGELRPSRSGRHEWPGSFGSHRFAGPGPSGSCRHDVPGSSDSNRHYGPFFSDRDNGPGSSGANRRSGPGSSGGNRQERPGSCTGGHGPPRPPDPSPRSSSSTFSLAVPKTQSGMTATVPLEFQPKGKDSSPQLQRGGEQGSGVMLTHGHLASTAASLNPVRDCAHVRDCAPSSRPPAAVNVVNTRLSLPQSQVFDPSSSKAGSGPGAVRTTPSTIFQESESYGGAHVTLVPSGTDYFATPSTQSRTCSPDLLDLLADFAEPHALDMPGPSSSWTVSQPGSKTAVAEAFQTADELIQSAEAMTLTVPPVPPPTVPPRAGLSSAGSATRQNTRLGQDLLTISDGLLPSLSGSPTPCSDSSTARWQMEVDSSAMSSLVPAVLGQTLPISAPFTCASAAVTRHKVHESLLETFSIPANEKSEGAPGFSTAADQTGKAVPRSLRTLRPSTTPQGASAERIFKSRGDTAAWTSTANTALTTTSNTSMPVFKVARPDSVAIHERGSSKVEVLDTTATYRDLSSRNNSLTHALVQQQMDVPGPSHAREEDDLRFSAEDCLSLPCASRAGVPHGHSESATAREDRGHRLTGPGLTEVPVTEVTRLSLGGASSMVIAGANVKLKKKYQ